MYKNWKKRKNWRWTVEGSGVWAKEGTHWESHIYIGMNKTLARIMINCFSPVMDRHVRRYVGNSQVWAVYKAPERYLDGEAEKRFIYLESNIRCFCGPLSAILEGFHGNVSHYRSIYQIWRKDMASNSRLPDILPPTKAITYPTEDENVPKIVSDLSIPGSTDLNICNTGGTNKLNHLERSGRSSRQNLLQSWFVWSVHVVMNPS